MNQSDDVVLDFGEEEFDRERSLKYDNIFSLKKTHTEKNIFCQSFTQIMRAFMVLPMVPMVYQYRSRFYQWYHW